MCNDRGGGVGEASAAQPHLHQLSVQVAGAAPAKRLPTRREDLRQAQTLASAALHTHILWRISAYARANQQSSNARVRAVRPGEYPRSAEGSHSSRCPAGPAH
jgi:hypothetical protein